MAISRRREHAREELGIAKAEKGIVLAIRSEEERREKQVEKRAALENDSEYKLLKTISTLLDKCLLDPIIGFFLPGYGDLLSFGLGLTYLHVALFKVKSIPLTLAVASNMVIDLLIGAVPIAGDVFDFFFWSYEKSYTLIVNFVEDDGETVKKVKRRAVVNLALIVILGYAVYWVIAKAIFISQAFWNWIAGLFG